MQLNECETLMSEACNKLVAAQVENATLLTVVTALANSTQSEATSRLRQMAKAALVVSSRQSGGQ